MIRLQRIVIGIAAAAAAASAAAACRAAPRSPAPVPAAPTPAAREVRLTQEIPDVAWLVEIREGGGGRPRPAMGTVRITAGAVNRGGIERDYGCHARATDAWPATWDCVVPFRRGAPDWAGLLARLDALGVMAPPPRDPAPAGGREAVVCGDGAPWALEVRVGGATAVRDAQGCGPVNPRRAAFEAGVDSVLAAIDAAARVRR